MWCEALKEIILNKDGEFFPGRNRLPLPLFGEESGLGLDTDELGGESNRSGRAGRRSIVTDDLSFFCEVGSKVIHL